MVKQTIIITDQDGLHARPASQLSKKASQFPGDISLSYQDRSINLKSILAVMSLAVPQNAEVIISVDGQNEADTLKLLIEHMKQLKLSS